MFKIGDAVVYGSSGVCMIDDIRNEYFLGEQALYYILTPVYSKGSTIFCPVNNDKLPIRAVRSKDELLSSLSSDTADTDEWIVNDQKRHEHFSAVLRTSDSGKLARMPDDVRAKLRRTLCRMINENTGGMICILL